MVAHGTGTPAVTAAEVAIDQDLGEVRIGGSVFHAGDMLTIDGTTGSVSPGRCP